MNDVNRDKRAAAQAAAAYVNSGMTIGLGTGSTVNYLLDELGKRIRQGLEMEGIPTSIKTEKLAREKGIPLTDFSQTTKIDLAIDGADEVDSQLQLIKGGGGSLVREKIVAAAADQLIIIVDASKRVPKLGAFPLPIEVVPFGWEKTAERIAAYGCTPVLRKNGSDPFISDNGNYILDCLFQTISQPEQLHQQMKQLVGVVETGLFLHMTDRLLVARNGIVDVITNHTID